MNRILLMLEISWLIILIISLSFGTWRLMTEGVASALWFYFVTAIAAIAYGVRRRQRISMNKQPR